MLDFLKKKADGLDLYAIIDGEMIDITQVSDPVFAERMLGDGVAFVPTSEIVYAPADGKVMMLAKSTHAIGLKLDSGLEVLIHIGLDTVALNGEGFKANVSNHQRVKKGDALISFDSNFMNSKGINMIVILVITNTSQFKFVKQPFSRVIAGVDKIINIL